MTSACSNSPTTRKAGFRVTVGGDTPAQQPATETPTLSILGRQWSRSWRKGSVKPGRTALVGMRRQLNLVYRMDTGRWIGSDVLTMEEKVVHIGAKENSGHCELGSLAVPVRAVPGWWTEFGLAARPSAPLEPHCEGATSGSGECCDALCLADPWGLSASQPHRERRD